ncbi:DUF7344 domain-containing protein [Halomicrococcus sp. NG-SE-24]|uniref:DUF7344 domain-containing protein n=1 Tax=Halomicrococcus sp. NG-SE-24 TaxID=3436928 RepID=UPI003D95577E
MDENIEREAPDLQQIDDLSSLAVQERSLSVDRILSAVANEHRRAILYSLTSASDRTLEYDALVDRVADRMGDENAEEGSDEHRQRVRIALHHSHLPKLAEAQIIDYEAEAGHVQFDGGELEQAILTLVESYDASQ